MFKSNMMVLATKRRSYCIQTIRIIFGEKIRISPACEKESKMRMWPKNTYLPQIFIFTSNSVLINPLAYESIQFHQVKQDENSISPIKKTNKLKL
jgi:hypothetical protein